MAKSTAVLMPNLGLYLDRPTLAIDPRALVACNNVRIKDGRIVRTNMGWSRFLAEPLNGPVTGIDNFFRRTGDQSLIFATTTDMYQYDEGDGSVSFITPRYEDGTVDVSGANPAVVTGTATTFETVEIKPGDQIAFGVAGETDPDAAWYTIDTVDSETGLTLTTAITGGALTGEDYTIRKLFTGTLFDWWCFSEFPDAQNVEGTDGDRWYATNGLDRVIGWDGASDQVYVVPTLDFRCRVLARYKNMMIYGNLLLDSGAAKPYSIRNSAIGEPENTTTDEAAENVTSDGVDAIVALYPLGDSLVIYGARSVVLAQFVEPPVLFVFRTAIDGIGPISGRAVADFGDFHEFIGPDSQYRFNGISADPIGGQVWREVLRKQSPQRFDLFLAHFDEENGEVIWGVPLTTDADAEDGPIQTAYTEHYLETVGDSTPTPFAQRDFTATATGYFDRQTTLTFDQIVTDWTEQTFRWNDRFFQAAFPFNLFGDVNGRVYTLGTADAQDGAPITSSARFPRRPAVDGRTKGVLTRVYPFAQRYPTPGATLTVRVLGADQAAGPSTALGDFSYDLAQSSSKFFVSPRKAARFFEIEFRSTATAVPWFLEGYDTDVAKGGGR